MTLVAPRMAVTTPRTKMLKSATTPFHGNTLHSHIRTMPPPFQENIRYWVSAAGCAEQRHENFEQHSDQDRPPAAAAARQRAAGGRQTPPAAHKRGVNGSPSRTITDFDATRRAFFDSAASVTFACRKGHDACRVTLRQMPGMFSTA